VGRKKLPLEISPEEGCDQDHKRQVNAESRQVTLTLAIEESDDLVEWSETKEKVIRSVDMPEGKKFYRFALDK
jgi:hypothetical protein